MMNETQNPTTATYHHLHAEALAATGGGREEPDWRTSYHHGVLDGVRGEYRGYSCWDYAVGLRDGEALRGAILVLCGLLAAASERRARAA